MATRELNILIHAKNLASSAIKGVKSELRSINKDIGRGLGNAGKNIERGIGIGIAAAAGGIAYAVKQAGDFEASLNTINTVAQVSQKELDGIGTSLRNLAKQTGTPLEDLTAGYYDLVSAGIKAADAQNVLANANKLAIGGLATTGESIDLLTTAINSYGGDASKATEFTNQFAEAIAAGKVTAAELAESFAQIGPIAAQTGIGLDELAAAYGVMTATGTPAAEASTQMRAAIIALQRPTAQMKEIQKSMNVDFLAMAKKKGLAFTYNEIAKAAKKAGIPMVQLTGRVEGALFAAQVAGDNYGKYSAELDKVRHSSDGAGVAQEQMAERQKGLNFQLGKLKANAKDAAITLGTAIIPKILPLFEKANAWIDAHQGDIAKFADNVAQGVAKAVEWAGSLDWKGIGASLKTAAEFSKGLVEAFLSMPDWVKQAVITGWGLNKLTGGAVGSIIGELGKGLVKGVLGMNAGVVNIKAGVVNGGGGGPGGGPVAGPTGGKSFGSKALGVIGGLTVAGFVADLAKTIDDSDITKGLEANIHDAAFSWFPDLHLNEMQWPFGPKNTPTILPEVFGGNGLLGGNAPAPTKPAAPLAPVAGTLGSHPLPVADPILASIEKRNASEYNRTITSNLAKQSTKITAGIVAHASSERADAQRTQARLDAVRAASDRHAAVNAARLAGIDAQTRNVVAASRNVPPALSRIEGVERGASGHLNTIAHKPFTATANVTVNSYASVRVDTLARALETHSYATVSGRRGGALM